MRHRIAILFLLLLPVSAARADVFVTPAAPTTATPVTVLITGSTPDSCSEPVGTPRVTIADGMVMIRYEQRGGGACLGVGYPWQRTVAVGTLPAGKYIVQAIVPTYGGPSPAGYTEILVASDGPGVIEPAGTPYAAPGEIQITIPTPEHGFGDDVQVVFGNDPPVPARRVGITPRSTRIAVTPKARERAETVDVRLQDPDGHLFTMRNAFTFYDSAGEPDRRAFEPVLIPIVFDGPGAYGSEWRTDLTIQRTGYDYWQQSAPVVSFRPIHSKPFDTPMIRPDSLGQRPRGLLYHVSRGTAPILRFALTIRELSRGGVRMRVPVVPASEFRTEMRLLDIPTSPRFRTKLRVYSTEPIEQLSAIFIGEELRLGGVGLRLTRAAADEPYYAEADIDPIFAGVRQQGLPVPDDFQFLIVNPAFTVAKPFWAWVTVTDNETQAVTFVTEK